MSDKRFNYEPSELKKHNEQRDKEVALYNYRKSNRYKQLLRDNPDESILYRECRGNFVLMNPDEPIDQ